MDIREILTLLGKLMRAGRGVAKRKPTKGYCKCGQKMGHHYE